jgi:two-component system response regulator AtoC
MTSDQAYKVLIVDDEPNMLHMLSTVLAEDGFGCMCAQSGKEALRLVATESFDFILSDIRMPGMDGLRLLEALKAQGTSSIVILMSAYGTVDLALEAIRKGAYDYISKPFKTDEVVLTFRKAAEREKLRREVIKLRRRLNYYEKDTEIIAKSNSMKDLLSSAKQIAPFDSAVLITGESGTGKELLARQIHRTSSRNQGPFVALNCSAIPTNLLETELFGYSRGAFTGATSDKPGLFEEADGGSLFLDELGAMEYALQGKLLRSLDKGEIRRLGENVSRSVSVRIIAATNEDLAKAIEDGRFREDLLYRLNVIHLHIPPLRERKEDILPLIHHFIDTFNKKLGFKIAGITREAQEALLRCPWKGNVRELQNVLERAMILASGDHIDADGLPHDISQTISFDRELEKEGDDFSLKRAQRELEKKLITRALNRTGGNRSQAAGLLEISYPSLLQKIKEYGLG